MTAPKIEWHCTGMSWRVRFATKQRQYSARVAMGLDGRWFGTLETTGGRKDRVVTTYEGKTFDEVRSAIDAVFLARVAHL
jgi:hypothetical protein